MLFKAFFCSLIQFTLIGICWFSMATQDAFQFKHPANVWTIITRFMMAIMMHFTVEPDIRNGLALMKYAVNHPGSFK